MHDLETSKKLTKFVNRDLGDIEFRHVEEHLAGCEECFTWVAAYRVVSESLQPSAARRHLSPAHLSPAHLSPAHLSIDELAKFALSEERLERTARERCSRHLEKCAECSEEIALVQAAAAEARRKPLPLPLPAARFARTASLSPLAWAAALVLVVSAAFLGFAMLEVPATGDLTGSTLTGRKTVRTPDSIWVETSTVESGAELTLRIRNTVAFGDGFSVDSGGTLSVIVDESHGS